MTTPRRSITILGAGHIGFAMALLLSRSGDYEVLVADRDPLRLHAVAALGVATCTTGDDAELQRAIEGRFAVLNALPFHCAVGVATLCARAGVHYFDLTEDVPSTQAIRALAQGARSVLMPQCGLAPGFIGCIEQRLLLCIGGCHEHLARARHQQGLCNRLGAASGHGGFGVVGKGQYGPRGLGLQGGWLATVQGGAGAQHQGQAQRGAGGPGPQRGEAMEQVHGLSCGKRRSERETVAQLPLAAAVL